MSPEEFVETFKPYAKIIYEVFGIPWQPRWNPDG